jgi:hypothetical protein
MVRFEHGNNTMVQTRSNLPDRVYDVRMTFLPL